MTIETQEALVSGLGLIFLIIQLVCVARTGKLSVLVNPLWWLFRSSYPGASNLLRASYVVTLVVAILALLWLIGFFQE